MNKIIIKSVPFYFRVLDFMMVPIMWALQGFAIEKPQELHRWHRQDVACAWVDESRALFVPASGNPRSGERVPQALHGIFIHLTPISNWKSYVVLEASGFSSYWHVGWKIRTVNGTLQCQTEGLRIYSPFVKMLTGRDAFFFGINKKGEQIPLRTVGRGIIGDGKFSHVRLF